jgi:hypothetical protein
MTGKHSELKTVPTDAKDMYGDGWHGASTKQVAVDLPSAANREFADVAPTSQMFSEGNGGESRKSFHGYVFQPIHNHSMLATRVRINASVLTCLTRPFFLPVCLAQYEHDKPLSAYQHSSCFAVPTSSFPRRYPRGYAQLMDSPTGWHITPMQVCLSFYSSHGKR